LELRTTSVAGTHAVAAVIAALARPGDLLVLAGEMGAGKTAFAQGFGQALGVTEPITSPTFTLVHSYDSGRMVLHHADLYRLDRMAEVADLALGELLEDHAVVLVEWGDVVANTLGPHLEVRLLRVDGDEGEEEDSRAIEVRPIGRQWTSRWVRLEADLREWQVPTC
jgi:tRNA threonylcarbamoyladenosine biosynthesis protein TsaE